MHEASSVAAVPLLFPHHEVAMEIPQVTPESIAGQDAAAILAKAEKAAESFKLFFTVVARLRAPDGCPWDRAQTPSSIRGNIIEEAYELAEAVTENDSAHMKEETGDLFLLASMVGYMNEQEGRYTVSDALLESASKLIRRHPHVFGEAEIDSPEQVVQQWNEIKEKVEGRRRRDSILDEVHRHLPPLEKAYKLQKKAAKAGFDWQKRDDIWPKVEEEMAELRSAHATSNLDALEEEFGDLLFAVINAARLYGVDPSIALHRTNEKFARRFRYVEARMKEHTLPLSPEHMELMDRFWNEGKEKERA